MTRGKATFWLVLGFTFAVIDAWLSMQAAFGFISPRNLLQFAAAAMVGLLFTLFAVLAEPLHLRKSALGFMFWLIMLALDVATSMVCAVWYGQFGHAFSMQINFAEITFDPSNWQVSSIYLGLVAVTAAFCIKFGQAIDFFLSE